MAEKGGEKIIDVIEGGCSVYDAAPHHAVTFRFRFLPASQARCTYGWQGGQSGSKSLLTINEPGGSNVTYKFARLHNLPGDK
jgi:hypothetical protein